MKKFWQVASREDQVASPNFKYRRILWMDGKENQLLNLEQRLRKCGLSSSSRCLAMICRGSLASRMLQCFPLHIQRPCESLCKDLWRAHSEPETRLPPKVLCRQQMLKIVISSEVSDSRSVSARKRQRPGLQGLKRGPSLAAKWVLRTIGSH